MFKERFKLRVRDAKDHILQLYEASATTEKAEEEIDLTGEDLVKQRDEDSVVDPQVEGGDTQEMQSGVYADAEEGPSDEYKYDEEQAVVKTSTSTSTSVPTSTSSKRKAGDGAARSPLLDPDSDASDSLIDREGKTEEDDTEDFAVLSPGNDTTIRLTPELRNKLAVLETLQHASED
ncbi:hypothetical protein PI126_g984 [Phytophthora idaei]|nr:hypothetical protein PI126_g984 [Phytophthora idaei]